jgi:hypothetical protein
LCCRLDEPVIGGEDGRDFGATCAETPKAQDQSAQVGPIESKRDAHVAEWIRLTEAKAAEDKPSQVETIMPQPLRNNLVSLIAPTPITSTNAHHVEQMLNPMV